jgi:hypothetical protein
VEAMDCMAIRPFMGPRSELDYEALVEGGYLLRLPKEVELPGKVSEHACFVATDRVKLAGRRLLPGDLVGADEATRAREEFETLVRRRELVELPSRSGVCGALFASLGKAEKLERVVGHLLTEDVGRPEMNGAA